MNAQELYELVKYWPAEAWPMSVYWIPAADGHPCGFSASPDSLYDSAIMSDHATLLFEASGIRWIGYHTDAIVGEWVSNDETFWSINLYRPEQNSLHEKPSLVRAIASAINAIKEAK